jgi:arginine exporter protein ArgO
VSGGVVAGLVAGYGIAVPVGAVGTYLVGLAARTSWRVGACAALGVASADGVYALLAVGGGSALAPLIEPLARPLQVLSAVVLLALAGLGTVRAVAAYRRRQGPGAARGDAVRPVRAYFGLLGVTLMNPVTVLYFAALVLGGQGTTAATPWDKAGFVAAAFAASASWQLLLAAGGTLLARALTTPTARLTTALVSSAVIAALALHLATGPG